MADLVEPSGVVVGTGARMRPASAVSEGVGFIGLGAITLFVLAVTRLEAVPGIAFVALPVAVTVAMALWSLLIDRVHRNPTTGLDFSSPRPFAEALATTKVKLVGLYATWAVMGLVYFAAATYRNPIYGLYFSLLALLSPLLLVAAPAYVFYVDRYLCKPQDALWHAGNWLLGGRAEPAMVYEHVRTWTIKGFFLALMFAGMPVQLASVTNLTLASVLESPASAALWFIQMMFLLDLTYAVIGYVVTSRLLDSHVRSSNPYTSGWIFTLLCYPPFIMMAEGGPLDYRDGMTWTDWLAGSDVLLAVWAVVVASLAAVYAWATVIFGLRFSNLTHRGVLTNGPFRFFKHPAYLSKNLFWWMAVVPFLSTDGPVEAVRDCLLLLCVNFVYYMRARTEEWHLMEDPAYRAYSAWIAENGVLPLLQRALVGGRRSRPPFRRSE